MGKKQTKRTVETPDMLTQKTYGDYNKKNLRQTTLTKVKAR